MSTKYTRTSGRTCTHVSEQWSQARQFWLKRPADMILAPCRLAAGTRVCVRAVGDPPFIFNFIRLLRRRCAAFRCTVLIDDERRWAVQLEENRCSQALTLIHHFSCPHSTLYNVVVLYPDGGAGMMPQVDRSGFCGLHSSDKHRAHLISDWIMQVFFPSHPCFA